MPATWNLLNKPVGPDLRNSKSNVRTLQQLLSAAGYDTGGDTGAWDDRTTRALLGFRDAHFPGPYRLEVSPDSDELLILVTLAQLEIPLPGATGMNGIQRMHDWFVERGTKYNQGAESGLGNRAIYGIRGHTGSAIQRINQAWRKGPVEMDCTTYVNLMLGIFFKGNAHQAPYDANCADYGGLSKVHCGRDRYGFKEISVTFGSEARSYVTTADEMTAVAKEDTLYVLEIAKSNNSVVHMALLYNGSAMECTINQPASACIKRSIADFMRGKRARIFMYEQT
jgi:hypothetical protein